MQITNPTSMGSIQVVVIHVLHELLVALKCPHAAFPLTRVVQLRRMSGGMLKQPSGENACSLIQKSLVQPSPLPCRLANLAATMDWLANRDAVDCIA